MCPFAESTLFFSMSRSMSPPSSPTGRSGPSSRVSISNSCLSSIGSPSKALAVSRGRCIWVCWMPSRFLHSPLFFCFVVSPVYLFCGRLGHDLPAWPFFFFGLSSGNGMDEMRLMRMKYEEIMGADKMIVIPRGNKDLETHHTHQVWFNNFAMMLLATVSPTCATSMFVHKYNFFRWNFYRFLFSSSSFFYFLTL